MNATLWNHEEGSLFKEGADTLDEVGLGMEWWFKLHIVWGCHLFQFGDRVRRVGMHCWWGLCKTPQRGISRRSTTSINSIWSNWAQSAGSIYPKVSSSPSGYSSSSISLSLSRTSTWGWLGWQCRRFQAKGVHSGMPSAERWDFEVGFQLVSGTFPSRKASGVGLSRQTHTSRIRPQVGGPVQNLRRGTDIMVPFSNLYRGPLWLCIS